MGESSMAGLGEAAQERLGQVGGALGAGVDRAKDALADAGTGAQAKLGEAVDVVRTRAGDLQARLADSLDAGAQAIRERTGAAGAAADPRRDGRLPGVGAAAAERLEATSMWLRENDLTDVGTLLEHQLREHPGRTALLALGVGYLIGRAARR